MNSKDIFSSDLMRNSGDENHNKEYGSHILSVINYNLKCYLEGIQNDTRQSRHKVVGHLYFMFLYLYFMFLYFLLE